MKPKKIIYGAYGSNMNLEQMSKRCPRAKVIGNTVLENYKLTFRGRYKGVANIEPCEGYSVPIVLWEITERCEKALDTYEGFPNLYTKKMVEVLVEDQKQEIMVYQMTEQYLDMPSPPTQYYFAVIARGYYDNDIELRTLQVAYSECLSEISQKQ